jgi:hypothetical protein
MSQAHLIPCPDCARHVRAFESLCPFCASAIPETLRAGVPARRPTGRLTRAALYTFGATSLTLAAACSSTSEPSGTSDAASDVSQADGTGSPDAIAHYGCPPADCNPDAESDVHEIFDAIPAYGAPGDAHLPPEDAGTDADSGVSAAYGAPGFDAH